MICGHEIESLKPFTVSEITALSDNKFQSLMVLGKNEFLYISVLVLITLICLLCPDLDSLVLNTMCLVAGIATRMILKLCSLLRCARGFHPSSFIIDVTLPVL